MNANVNAKLNASNRKNQKLKNFLIYSVLFHVVIITALVLSFEFKQPMPVVKNSDQDLKIMNAIAMDEAPAGTKLPKFLPDAKPPKIPSLVERKKITPADPLPQPKREPEIIPKNPPRKIDTLSLQKTQHALLEKDLLADLNQIRNKQIKNNKPEKKVKKTIEPFKKVQAKEIENEFAKELKSHQAEVLAQQLLQEKNILNQFESQKMRGIVDKYKALILQAISKKWLVPPTVNKKLSCELLIRVAPGGMVLDAQVAKSSGDVALDRSARAAVFKASPLPVPTVAEGFEAFKQFILKVKPDNIEKLNSSLS